MWHTSSAGNLWCTHREGFLKLNTDVSFIEALGLASAGAIARNSNGDVTFSASCLLPLHRYGGSRGQRPAVRVQTL